MATRRIRIDDTDPAIKYAPNQWFPHDVNQLNTLGNLGSVWNGTSHSTSTTTASLTFPFNGTSIDVIGTIQLNDLADDPTWVCLVDEIQITNGTDPTFKFPENNWILCSQPQLLPGPHTLTIKVQSKGQPFYLDSIFYTPTPDVTYDGAVLEYDAGDPAISYGAGWQFYTVENTQNITQTNGAQVALNFHGTAVTLTGYVPQELPHNATTAKYSVDGGPATTVTLAGLPPQGTTTIFNVPMLSVSNLSPTTHNIVVTYEGDSGHTPLAVKNFYVTNSTTPVLADSHFSSASSPSSTPSKTSTPPVVATKHTPVGAIAGGVVGGLALLALLAGLLFFLRRRRQRERGETPQRPGHDVDPFGIETAEAGGGAGAASIATGRATHGTSDAAGAGYTPHPGVGAAYGSYSGSSSALQHAQHDGNPFDPYAESGSGGGSLTTPATASGTTAYPYPYVSVPHNRTLSGGSSSAQQGSMSASTPSAQAQAQGSVSSPSNSSSGRGGGGGGGGGGGALAVVGGPQPVRTKAEELALTPQRRVVVQRHQDSGVRLRGSNSTPSLLEPEVVDLPPDYSRD